jgi:hypothetical protein
MEKELLGWSFGMGHQGVAIILYRSADKGRSIKRVKLDARQTAARLLPRADGMNGILEGKNANEMSLIQRKLETFYDGIVFNVLKSVVSFPSNVYTSPLVQRSECHNGRHGHEDLMFHRLLWCFCSETI